MPFGLAGRAQAANFTIFRVNGPSPSGLGWGPSRVPRAFLGLVFGRVACAAFSPTASVVILVKTTCPRECQKRFRRLCVILRGPSAEFNDDGWCVGVQVALASSHVASSAGLPREGLGCREGGVGIGARAVVALWHQSLFRGRSSVAGIVS